MYPRAMDLGTEACDIRATAASSARTRPKRKEGAVSGIVTLMAATAIGPAFSLTRSHQPGAALSAEKYSS